MSGFKAGFNKYGNVIEHKADDTSKLVMNALKSAVAANTPVRTGYLKSRWKVVRRKLLNYSLVNDAPYALYVEEGTSRHAGAHMLKKGIQQTKGISLGAKAIAGAAAISRSKK